MPIDLAQKVGPLPAGAWVIAVVGGVGIVYMRSRNKAAPTNPIDATTTDPFSAVGTGPGNVGWISTNPPDTTTQTAGATLATNTDWGAAVERYLIAKGYDPAIVDSMVRNALADNQLSAQEMSLYSLALIGVGPMPEPLPPAQAQAPAPAPAQSPAYKAPAAYGIDWHLYPLTLPFGTPMAELGTIANHQNVVGGAPVYALIGNVWQQGWAPNQVNSGTRLATLPQFVSNEV